MGVGSIFKVVYNNIPDKRGRS